MERTSITVPAELLEPFRQYCEDNNRSVSGQVSWLIKQCLRSPSKGMEIEAETENLIKALEEVFCADWDHTIARLRDKGDYSGFLDYSNIWRWHRRDELAEAYTTLKELLNQ
jgi:hypothetical protein